jgi:ABC-2 type transport system ATP-binding protein
MRVADLLDGEPGVEIVARFGAAVHACGRNAEALARAVERAIRSNGVQAKPIEAGFEEIFIFLTAGRGEPLS